MIRITDPLAITSTVYHGRSAKIQTKSCKYLSIGLMSKYIFLKKGIGNPQMCVIVSYRQSPLTNEKPQMILWNKIISAFYSAEQSVLTDFLCIIEVF